MKIKQALYLGAAAAALALAVIAPTELRAQQARPSRSAATTSAASSPARTGRKPASG